MGSFHIWGVIICGEFSYTGSGMILTSDPLITFVITQFCVLHIFTAKIQIQNHSDRQVMRFTGRNMSYLKHKMPCDEPLLSDSCFMKSMLVTASQIEFEDAVKVLSNMNYKLRKVVSSSALFYASLLSTRRLFWNTLKRFYFLRTIFIT